MTGLYSDILEKIDSGKYSDIDILELVKNAIVSQEKRIEVENRHKDFLLNKKELTAEEFENIKKEELEVGNNRFLTVPNNIVNVEDAIIWDFLEGSYTLYDDVRDLKILENNLKHKIESSTVESLFKEFEKTKSEESRKSLLNYLQSKIDELENLKKRIENL